MDSRLNPEELRWLRQLDTDALVKPELPIPIADTLIEHGLAIRLVEGGLQLTAFGREHLTLADESGKKA